MTAVNYFAGLDLGQVNDFTALAILTRRANDCLRPGQRPVYALGYLERYPMGTPYREIFASVRTMLRSPPVHQTILAVDTTGVGQAVLELLEETLSGQVSCLLCRACITSCMTIANVASANQCIPKKELVGVLQVLLQNRRLQIPRSLPHAQVLLNELLTFKMKLKAPKADQALQDWRKGPQDDLIFAIGLAAFYGEMALPTGENE
jgi:hypothetical protein